MQKLSNFEVTILVGKPKTERSQVMSNQANAVNYMINAAKRCIVGNKSCTGPYSSTAGFVCYECAVWHDSNPSPKCKCDDCKVPGTGDKTADERRGDPTYLS